LLCFGLITTDIAISAAQADTVAPSLASILTNSVLLSEQTIDFTLEDAVLLGLRNNRSIRGAYLGRIAQKFDLRVAEDRFSPKLILSGRHLATRNQDDRYRQADVIPQTTLETKIGTRFSLAWSNQLTQANRYGRSRNDGAVFTAIQPLLRGGGRNVATAPVRLARLTEQRNQLILKGSVSDTIAQIIIAYRELLRAQEQLKISREALKRSYQLLEANKAMIAAGRMAAFDIVQTEADAATQELSVEEAANQLDTSRLELLRLLALDLTTRVQAVDTLEAQRIEVSFAEALAAAHEQQPSYLIQLIAVEQAAINLALARNEKMWDVSLVAGASQVRDRYPVDGGDRTNRTWEGYAGIQIDIPLGDLSRRQTEVHAHTEIQSQNIRLAEARQSMERDVGDAVRNIDTRWRQYEIAQRALDLSRRKLELEREKLNAGRSSNFQVLSFEADLRGAENTRVNALIAYLNSQTTLDRVLGTTLESWEIELND
jgi:outer membrane protein TolC